MKGGKRPWDYSTEAGGGRRAEEKRALGGEKIPSPGGDSQAGKTSKLLWGEIPWEAPQARDSPRGKGENTDLRGGDNGKKNSSECKGRLHARGRPSK